MDLDKVKAGLRVVTRMLQEPTGMLVDLRYLSTRKSNASGTVRCFVPGHGGDVWAIDHDDGSTAVYFFTEFEVEK